MTSEAVSWAEPWIDDDGLLRVVTTPGVRRKDAVAYTLETAESLVDGPTPMLCDVRAMSAATPDAWSHFIGRIDSLASALAFVVSYETTPVDSFQQAINSLLVPCRIFDSESAATAWLRSTRS